MSDSDVPHGSVYKCPSCAYRFWLGASADTLIWDKLYTTRRTVGNWQILWHLFDVHHTEKGRVFWSRHVVHHTTGLRKSNVVALWSRFGSRQSQTRR